MPIARVARGQPLSKRAFHDMLRTSLEETDDERIDAATANERTAWVWVEDGGRLVKLHADTTRAGVRRYLELVAQHGEHLDWTVVPSEQGRWSKIAFGPAQAVIPGFYAYLKDAQVQEPHHGSNRTDDDSEYEGREGDVRLQAHLRRERDAKIVRLKKQRVMEREGVLLCEVCGFDFAREYGELGRGTIECHHLVPLSEVQPGSERRSRTSHSFVRTATGCSTGRTIRATCRR